MVHSIIYYAFNTTLLDDAVFDVWARELAQLQTDNPEVAESVEYMRDEFADFNGETGFHLPLHDIRASRVAKHLIAGSKKNV